MLLITGNKNKVKEFEEILGFKIKSLSLDLEEIQEVDIEKVSEYKARKAYEKTKEPIIVEDIGLFFDELNGLPGALIKWFEKRLSYEEICNLIKKNRKATAKICITYFNGKKIKQFIGEIKGTISDKPRGENGFGWDCIFIPKGSEKTFAEMKKEEKNNISMRKIALEKMKSCNFVF
ncbi:MAG: RdgB/HAM1 family non-canonical purine NTP pyrophosphatase [Candidatus Pacebacteria bacterium]|nr:RdgB/HAM1 family non-canonical purine NTP pyrophosphatase [Candidatus Paceibacterota bacterium]